VAGDHRFAALSTSLADFVTCGLVADGQAYCWGPDHPNRGGLGTGTAGGAPTPVAVAGDLRFVSLSVGEFHTCGVATGGAAYCWGGNWYGTLGIGSAGGEGGPMTKPLPVPVLGDHAFTRITASTSNTCGLTAAGGVLCWGSGRPFGGEGYVTAPLAVDQGIAFTSVHAGGQHTCGLTAQGVAYCWGENDAGELGDGSTEYRSTPAQVAGNLRFSSLALGGVHTCGLATNGRAYCWGLNAYGQVGRPGSDVDPPTADSREVSIGPRWNGFALLVADDAEAGWAACSQRDVVSPYLSWCPALRRACRQRNAILPMAYAPPDPFAAASCHNKGTSL
jgi:alpha-tubulin suppressor-like RCC1 family protein